MDAKTELIDKLCVLFPEGKVRISELLSQYSVRWEAEAIQSNLRQRIQTFLVAKKIDGLSPKTLKNYREMLDAFAAHVFAESLVGGYIGCFWPFFLASLAVLFPLHWSANFLGTVLVRFRKSSC